MGDESGSEHNNKATIPGDSQSDAKQSGETGSQDNGGGGGGSDPSRPLFLKPPNLNDDFKKGEVAKPPDMTWGDYNIRPDRPLNARQRKLAEMAALGHSNKEIVEKLKYTDSHVSILLGNSKIQAEIDRIRDRLYEPDVEDRIKSLGPDALDVYEQILRDPSMSASKKESAARWMLEKITGRPAQQVDVSSDINIAVFLDKLDKLKTVREIPAEKLEQGTSGVIEVTTSDPLNEWLDNNLKDE